MSSGSIQDWQIASSSQWTGVGDLTEFAGSSSSSSSSQGVGGGMYNNQGGSCQPKYARLYQSGNKAWCAKHRSVGEWILVDLGVISQVWTSEQFKLRILVIPSDTSISDTYYMKNELSMNKQLKIGSNSIQPARFKFRALFLENESNKFQ